MTNLEIHYNSPEGPKVTRFKSDEDGLKLAREFSKIGLNIIRETDQLFIPPNSIICITHVKTNT